MIEMGSVEELERLYGVVAPEFVTVNGTKYSGFTLEEIIADQQRQHPDRLAELCATLPQEPLVDRAAEDGLVKAVLYALVPSLAIWAVLWACFKIWRAW